MKDKFKPGTPVYLWMDNDYQGEIGFVCENGDWALVNFSEPEYKRIYVRLRDLIRQCDYEPDSGVEEIKEKFREGIEVHWTVDPEYKGKVIRVSNNGKWALVKFVEPEQREDYINIEDLVL